MAYFHYVVLVIGICQDGRCCTHLAAARGNERICENIAVHAARLGVVCGYPDDEVRRYDGDVEGISLVMYHVLWW
jgi:hypothetical protein